MTLPDILKQLGITSGLGIILFYILRFLLMKVMSAKIDVLKSQEIETFKAKLAAELEETKHKLEIEAVRQTSIFDKKKESYSKITNEINNVFLAFAEKYDKEKRTWQPIDFRTMVDCAKGINAESFYVSNECVNALELFMDIMGNASVDMPGSQGEPPNSDTVEDVFEILAFLNRRIIDYFRFQVGVSLNIDPFEDVYLFWACYMCKPSFVKRSFYWCEKNTEREEGVESPEEVVLLAKENIHVLIEELNRYIQDIKKEKSYDFYKTKMKARLIIERITQWKDRNERQQ
ncbi:MAG: hypothetical protein ABIH66_03275 [bacterium]